METNVPGSEGDPGEVSDTGLIETSSLLFDPGIDGGVSEVALEIVVLVGSVTVGSTSAKSAESADNNEQHCGAPIWQNFCGALNAASMQSPHHRSHAKSVAVRDLSGCFSTLGRSFIIIIICRSAVAPLVKLVPIFGNP